jgi:hypothetical protein
MLVFDSRYFHGPSAGFGTSLRDCRLIQVFNFCFSSSRPQTQMT